MLWWWWWNWSVLLFSAQHYIPGLSCSRDCVLAILGFLGPKWCTYIARGVCRPGERGVRGHTAPGPGFAAGTGGRPNFGNFLSFEVHDLKKGCQNILREK